jgi:hypothetical protein
VTIAALLLVLSQAAVPADAGIPTIDWPAFFSRVANQGLEYSESMRALEGKRVRLRGYAILDLDVPGGLLLSHDPGAELHDAGEVELPYDAVGVQWRKGLSIPSVPKRPTIEGTLRLGNHVLGGQTVAILIEDATPVYPARPQQKPR